MSFTASPKRGSDALFLPSKLLLQPVQYSLNVGKGELLERLFPDLVCNLFSALLMDSSNISVDRISSNPRLRQHQSSIHRQMIEDTYG